MTLSTVLKWHGGKAYLAPQFWEIVDASDFVPIHVVEPFFGGGAFTLYGLMQGRDLSFVANDINKELSNFWKVLATPDLFRQFFRKVEAIPFSEGCWEGARDQHDKCTDPVDRALLFFIFNRQCLAGRMGDPSFAGVTKTRTRRGMNEQVSAWLSSVEGLPEIHKLLIQVLILNQDGLNVILKHDTPNTLFYIDPTYLPDTRKTTGEYKHEMTVDDHEDILVALSSIKGKFLLSGYDSPMYQGRAFDCNWKRYEFDLPNNAAGVSQKQRKTECLWTNL